MCKKDRGAVTRNYKLVLIHISSCAYFCLQLTLVQALIVSMMVTVIWMKTIRLTASVLTNMKESFARKVGFYIKYDVIYE